MYVIDRRNDGACYCEFPDSQVQQEGPTVETLLDQNNVTDPDERERELTTGQKSVHRK